MATIADLLAIPEERLGVETSDAGRRAVVIPGLWRRHEDAGRGPLQRAA